MKHSTWKNFNPNVITIKTLVIRDENKTSQTLSGKMGKLKQSGL
jgi:hypothetical protein